MGNEKVFHTRFCFARILFPTQYYYTYRPLSRHFTFPACNTNNIVYNIYILYYNCVLFLSAEVENF